MKDSCNSLQFSGTLGSFFIFPELSEGRCHSIECQRANLCMILFSNSVGDKKVLGCSLTICLHLRNAHLILTFIENRFVHNSNQRITPQALCQEGLYRFY